MRKIRSLLLTLALAALYSCGDAGFGFDVAAELPVDAGEMVIPIPGTGLPFDIDPEALSFRYNLNDVDGFNDAIRELRDNRDKVQIFLLGIAYEIDGVNDAGDTYNESVPVSEARLDFNLAGSTESLSVEFPVDSGSGERRLVNQSKTDLNITGLKALFENELENSENVSVDFVLDVGTFTTTLVSDQVDFNITVYFDVAIRVTNINN